MASLSPTPKLQFFDNGGNPLVGVKLYTYLAGTLTPSATFTDSTGTANNSNPVILDSRGEASIWLGSGVVYKFALQDAGGVPIYTVDNVSPATSSGGGGGGGTASVTVSDTAPTGPSAGNLWWKSDEGQMYIYYTDVNSSQWVVANAYAGGAAYLPIAGGTLTGALNGTNASFSGTLGVTGAATLNSTLGVTGAATLSSTLGVTGAATAAALIPTGSTIPANGMYLSAANTLNLATNTTNQVSISSGGIVTGTAGNLMLVSGTAQASTSGTSVNFTSVIPTWAKRVTMAFNGVSTGSTNNLIVQLGVGGTYVITGYSAQTTGIASSSGASSSSTVGFPIYHNVATYAWSGVVTLHNVSGNIWVASGVLGNATTTALSAMTSGVISLAGVLDSVRVIASATGSPSDTFDAGSINILYE